MLKNATMHSNLQTDRRKRPDSKECQVQVGTVSVTLRICYCTHSRIRSIIGLYHGTINVYVPFQPPCIDNAIATTCLLGVLYPEYWWVCTCGIVCMHVHWARSFLVQVRAGMAMHNMSCACAYKHDVCVSWHARMRRHGTCACMQA